MSDVDQPHPARPESLSSRLTSVKMPCEQNLHADEKCGLNDAVFWRRRTLLIYFDGYTVTLPLGESVCLSTHTRDGERTLSAWSVVTRR